MKNTLIGMVALSLLPLSAQAESGYTYDLTLRVTDAKNKVTIGRAHVLTTGSKARVEMLEGGKDLKPGDYSITLDGGVTTTSVSPVAKTIEWSGFAQAAAEILKEKGLSASNLKNAWSEPAPNQKVVTRSFQMVYKELIFRQNISVQENHSFTMAAPGAGPTFNPLVNATAIDLGSYALKFPEIRQAGPHGLFPAGFVTKAVLNLQAKIGKKNEGARMEIEASVPVPADIPESAFALPTGYKLKR